MDLMKKYITVKKIDRGIITHADKEADGLSFRVVARLYGSFLVVLGGDSVNINRWILRVDGTEITKAEADEYGKAMLDITKDDRMSRGLTDSQIESNRIFDINNY